MSNMKQGDVSAAPAADLRTPVASSDVQQRGGMLHLEEQQQYGPPQHMQFVQQSSQPFVQTPQGLQPAAAVTPSAPRPVPAQRQWVRYYIQRVTTNINHVLFYVVDEGGYAKLAVVGTDVKLSGHFVYASVSDMTEASALRCTNRAKVLEWLSDLGAAELAEDHEVTLPQLAPHHWQQLHSANPMMARPQLDRNYGTWREDVGTLPDGRHFKHYLLVDSESGAERLAVVGEDSARLDRRYTYKAQEDLGGFCFENGKAVQDWLDFVVGRTSTLPSALVRRDKQPPEKKKSKRRRGTGGSSAAEDEQEQPPPPPMEPHRPPVHLGAGGRLPAGLPPPAGAGRGVVSPAPAFGQQYMGAQQYQPGLQQPHSSRFPAAPLGSGGFGTPGMLAGPPGAAEGVDLNAAVMAAGEEVRQLFQVGGQALLEFVTHVPDQESINMVAEMSHRLSSFVEGLGLTGLPASSTAGLPEVLEILQFLGDRPVSLKLLETTGIGRPVALLGFMHDVFAAHGQQLRPEAARELQAVHEVAQHLADTWQDLASTAQLLANQALESSPAVL